MRHFIEMDVSGYGYIDYYHNSYLNRIGDFSSFNYLNYQNWFKYRLYRGEYAYSKKPHYEGNGGDKSWYYIGKPYSSYEEYLMVMVV